MGLAGKGNKGGAGLRTIANVSTVLLLALSLTGAVVTAVVTTRLGHTAAEVEHDVETIKAGERVRVALLDFSVESNEAFISKSDTERARVDREANLARRLADARRMVPRDEHRQLVDDAERTIRDYVAARREAELTHESLSDVITAALPQLRAANFALQRAIDAESVDIERVHANARTWTRLGVNAAIISWVAIVLAFGLVLTAMYRWVLRPVLELTDAMRAFGRGDRTVRAPLAGSRETDELAGTFNDLADRTVRQDRERLTFLAGVAHDLRNPLAAMRVATHYLDKSKQLPEPKVRATMALVDRQVTRLERMVGDILDASRIEAGHLELEAKRHDIRKLAEDTVQLYRAAAADTNHDLVLNTMDMDAPVDCDPERIAQVLNNLVSNAIKYSPSGGRINVSVTRTLDRAVIAVTDQGIGIAPADLESIFEPFRRAGASKELIPGVGLGLSVSRRIIEAHHGTLEVTSRFGEGSTFFVRLPIAPQMPVEQGAAMH